MDRMIEVDSDMNPIAYAWPGGYPVFYLGCEGYRSENEDGTPGALEFSKYDRSEFVMCPKCAAKEKDSKILIAAEVNYEDAHLFCEVCSERIESAYAEGDDDAKETDKD